MIKMEESELLSILWEVKQGNKEAFKKFFSVFQPSVYYFIYRYTSDKEAAEDLCQETFIKFWMFKSKLDLNSSPKAYLFRIARNLAFNYLTRKPPVNSYDEDENLLISISKNPEQDYETYALIDDLQKALNILPERCRTTFILSRYEGLEYSEIAESMNVSLQTVKNQMNKAISILKKKLASKIN
jgi:RNA polymerase sigma-70 factor (ECF subfamily)